MYVEQKRTREGTRLLIVRALVFSHRVAAEPYTLCVAECPPAFSLSSPNKYGGPNYPGANTCAARPGTKPRARPSPTPSTHGSVGPLHVLAAPRELALPLPIGCKHEIHFPTG